MDYDFGKLIEKAKNDCRTKSDFISMIDNEKVKLSESEDGRSSIQKNIFSQRLDNAKFSIKKGTMKVPDEYNEDLRNLFDGLR